MEDPELNSGLAQDWWENCKRYKDDQHKLVCVSASRSNGSLLAQGLNEKARREFMEAEYELKSVQDNLQDDIGRPEKHESETDFSVTVVDKVKK